MAYSAASAEGLTDERARFNSLNWGTRAAVFEELRNKLPELKAEGNGVVKLPPETEAQIVRLLLRENRPNNDPPRPESADDEGRFEYWVSLIAAVERFGTPEATAALLDPQVLGEGETVSSIARTGHGAVAPVLATFDAARQHGPAWSAAPPSTFGWGVYVRLLVNVIGLLAERPDVTQADRAQLRARLVTACSYADRNVHTAAMEALAALAK